MKRAIDLLDSKRMLEICYTEEDAEQYFSSLEQCLTYSQIEKVLDDVQTGEDIYPSSVFVPPTKEYLHEVHLLIKEKFGTGLDGISAHCMKYARDIALADIKEAIRKELS